jgi:hypothetical protein
VATMNYGDVAVKATLDTAELLAGMLDTTDFSDMLPVGFDGDDDRWARETFGPGSDTEPRRDDWTAFSRALFHTDDPMAPLPHAWMTAVASLLHRKGYPLEAVHDVLAHAALHGSVECLSLVLGPYRADVERLLPDRPIQEWERPEFDGTVGLA